MRNFYYAIQAFFTFYIQACKYGEQIWAKI